MTKEEVFKIYHWREEVENTINPRQVYAHGDLEKDLGFDIIKLSSNFAPNINSHRYAKAGEYKCSWRGYDCILFVKPSYEGAVYTTQGICCYADDEETLGEIEKSFNELI